MFINTIPYIIRNAFCKLCLKQYYFSIILFGSILFDMKYKSISYHITYARSDSHTRLLAVGAVKDVILVLPLYLFWGPNQSIEQNRF